MAKLGPYSYPDIRFGDAVEIAGRILSKFKGTVSVKGLAWELGMAEGSGTLFAKVAALRDFGLVEGRGELRISPLAQRVLHPAGVEEGRTARAEAFARVELLRLLYNRFGGEMPDDVSLLVGLEEITRAPRGEIVRRSSILQKHLTDAVRVFGRQTDESPKRTEEYAEYSFPTQTSIAVSPAEGTAVEGKLTLAAGQLQFAAPLTPEYVDAAIGLLTTLKDELLSEPRPRAAEARTPDEAATGVNPPPGAGGHAEAASSEVRSTV